MKKLAASLSSVIFSLLIISFGDVYDPACSAATSKKVDVIAETKIQKWQRWRIDVGSLDRYDTSVLTSKFELEGKGVKAGIQLNLKLMHLLISESQILKSTI